MGYFASFSRDKASHSVWSWMARHPELSEPGLFSTQILNSLPVVKTLVVQQGDTLQQLLMNAGAAVDESQQAIDALRDVYNPRNLRVGQEITVTMERDADDLRLSSLFFQDDPSRHFEVRRDDANGFGAQQVLYPLETVQVRAIGEIDTSLYLSALEAGVSPRVLSQMVQIFSYDVDFQREIRKGDRFEIFYERQYNDLGQPVRDGRVIAASMTLRGQEMKYYFYTPSDDEEGDYFNALGQSVRKALLRTPIDGARLSSNFGMRRHPILGYSRMHTGVDFAAPTGTPIFAAGDGVVTFSGTRGGYGLFVMIRHNSTYTTAYAHMSRIAVSQGQRVRQGQTIGFVGSTGRSTGPHLHYEVLVNGQHINPLDVRLPSGRNLEGRELARFREAMEAIDRQIAAVPQSRWLTSARE